MSESLEVSVLGWIERSHGSAAEQATLGEVEISAEGLVLTELLDKAAQTVRRSARVSVLHLGRWFASNWWRLRWEPEAPGDDWRLSHDLGAAGGGFLWPNLRFSSDGAMVAVSSHSTRRRDRQPVRYLNDTEVSVPVKSFERAVDDLMQTLVARLDAVGLGHDDVVALWHDVCAERRDPALSRLRRREALLGCDPDSLPPEAMKTLVTSGAWMGDAALDEVMAAARLDHVTSSLSQLKESSVTASLELDVTAMLPAAAEPSAVSRTTAPWVRGRDLATRVRESLRLGLDPISASDLNDLLRIDGTAMQIGSVTDALGAGFRVAGSPERIRAGFGRGRHSTTRRFELARIVGDALAAGADESVLPVTDAATARQKAQRAFAQEFLCPIEGLRNVVSAPSPSSDEVTEAAARYGVSEWTVITALVNHGDLPRAYLERMQQP